MKLAIKIFTIFIITLSITPCGDGGGGIIKIANHLFGVETPNYSETEQNSDPCEDAPCSPFCICNSCYTAFETAKEICLPEKIITSSPITTPLFISHFYTTSFNQSIWQPPKLG